MSDSEGGGRAMAQDQENDADKGKFVIIVGGTSKPLGITDRIKAARFARDEQRKNGDDVKVDLLEQTNSLGAVYTPFNC